MEARTPPSLRYLTAWYVTSLCLLLLLSEWKFGSPVWLLPRSDWLPLACLATAFMVSAGLAALLRPAIGWRALWLMAVSTIANFGVVFLGFIVTKTDFSRAITIATFLLAVMLVPAPYLVGASRRAIALGALFAVVMVGPFASRLMPQAPLQTSTRLIKTEYYNLNVETYSGAFPKSVVRGGALARIGDSYLRLSGDGHLDVFGWEAGTDRLKVTPLPYRVPINGDEFAAAAGRPWVTPRHGEGFGPEEGQGIEGSEVLNTEWFRTYGLLVQETGYDVRVFVSHNYWKAAQQCWVNRVSMLELTRAATLRDAAGPEWKTLYETTPCLPVRGEGRRHGIPFVGYFGGGRMALLDAQTLLLTVGDFGFDGVASLEAHPQNPATSYGKTIAINIADGRAALFTLGNRNPQGLFIDRSGTIWSTEHGPQGGDELNRLELGKNYGWPYATYGTQYGSFSWPLNKPEAEQGYQTPVFAWVPSIGVSNLLVVEGKLFPRWRGDLLVASLKGQTLFRARFREGHVVYLEPIVIGSRIRDLIEGHDGQIILWTDDDTLVSLHPKEGTSGEALFAEKCGGCHASAPMSGNFIGPNLIGVVGRRVASLGGYPDYSPALRKLGGVWTEERLDVFLKAPGETCPGTAMDYPGDPNAAERTAIIGYLRTLRF
jgi:cytochrome c2